MIDTIVLTLTQDLFEITEPDRFIPSARWILKYSSTHYSGIISKKNLTKKDLLKGIYKPRLTLSQQPVSRTLFESLLKIELSLPKLLYGNNFDELQYKDFNLVVDKLVLTLTTMGVIVTHKAIENASVAAIHYSKNIPLLDGSTPYHYITKIKEANVKLSLDTNQTDYRNEGHSFKWHCNSYEVAFYDKIKDLQQAKQSSKRAIEKDNELQDNLFEVFEKRRKLEFLRMEVRLNKRTKIKQLFNLLDINVELTFKKLFKPAIAKKVLLHYLDEIENKRSPLLDFKTTDDKTFLSKLSFNNPTLKPKQAMALFGLKKALEATTIRELKNLFGKENQQNWYRFLTEIDAVSLPSKQISLGFIRAHIMQFKPVKLTSY